MKAVLLVLAIVSCQRLALISDVHLDIDYQPDIPILDSNNKCHDLLNTGIRTKDIANYGRRGCDSPIALLNTVLAKIKQVSPNNDAILFMGDITSHHVPYHEHQTLRGSNWDKMKATFSQAISAMISAFPNTPIVLTLGNDDLLYHNKVPTTSFKAEYYQFVYDSWFTNIASNKQYNNANNLKTILNGGYYYMDINSIRYISMNSMYYTQGNDMSIDPTAANDQLTWVNSTLIEAGNKGMKAILLYHEFLGDNISPIGPETFWVEPYKTTFINILKANADTLAIGCTGHTHMEDYRVNNIGICKSVKSLIYNNNFILRAISPIYNNNPGFSLMSITNSVPAAITSYTFLVDKTINATSPDSYWYKLYDSGNELGLKNITAYGIAEFQTRVASNSTLYQQYLSFKNGKFFN